MAKDIVQRTAAALGTVDDKTLREEVSNSLVTTGVGGLMVFGAAALIPYVTVLMALVIVLVGGIALKFKS